MQNLHADAYIEPFPHLIYHDFYDDNELELIWEELKFLTKPDKLVEAKDFGGVVDKTNSHALALDFVYKNNRKISNILTVNRKLFRKDIMQPFADIHGCCSIANSSNYDVTKVRYYHNDEYYDSHTDMPFQYLAFSYFYQEPKKFEGGELFFPQYDYELSCENNSMIIFPGWVEHGVNKVKIENSDYFQGYGRYCISSFFGFKDKPKNEK